MLTRDQRAHLDFIHDTNARFAVLENGNGTFSVAVGKALEEGAKPETAQPAMLAKTFSAEEIEALRTDYVDRGYIEQLAGSDETSIKARALTRTNLGPVVTDTLKTDPKPEIIPLV